MRIQVALVCAFALAGSANAASAPQYQIVDASDIKAFWVAKSGHEQRPPKYSGDTVRKRIEACIELGFSIEPSGVPAQFKVLRSSFSQGAPKEAVETLRQAVTDSVSATRYDPAQGNPQRLPVYTHKLFTFRIAPSHESTTEREAGKEHIKQSCKIDDFKAFMDAALKKISP